jgi:predicted RNase H-like nuclease
VRVAGIDGTKGGWVAITLHDGRFDSDYLLRPMTTDFGEISDVDLMAIDIPIGYGPRAADSQARSFLGGNAGTVFMTPAQEVLEAPFGPGLGVSAQSHALGPRIIHVTTLARRDSRFHEVHPEVSFRAMKGEPLHHRKKSFGGARERMDLLRRNGLDLAPLGPAAAAPLDDVLDAAAAAWSAHRIAAGRACTLPDPPQLIDEHRVAIWY